jgi:sterol desaturase/sphingolipid hydroxylase (fatty acid hydroxylase superfamily)
MWAPLVLTNIVGAMLVAAAFHAIGIRPLLSFEFRGDTMGWALRLGMAAGLTFVSAFLYDFVYYWFHRLQHAVPLLWRFHAVHHSIEDLNAMNCSHHWLEGFLKAMLIVVPLALVIELRYSEIAVFGFLVGTWGQFVHADSRLDFGPFGRLIVSPVFHRVHHSLDKKHFDKNFAGYFSILDVAFGTAVFAPPNTKFETGLSDKHEPRTVHEYLIRLRPK